MALIDHSDLSADSAVQVEQEGASPTCQDGRRTARTPAGAQRGARLEAQCDELREEGPTFETINSRCPAFLAHRGQAVPARPTMNGSPRAIWTRNCWMVHAAVGCSVTFSAGFDTCPTLRTTKTAGIRTPTITVVKNSETTTAFASAGGGW